ncbi:MAG: PQQ-binding-like beta-propeller repeat protein, partial [Planctomycetota bacterium]
MRAGFRLMCICCCIALLRTGLGAAEHAYVTATWSIQQEAGQLAAALAQRPRDPDTVLEHLQRFLAEHGTSLVRADEADAQRPAHEVLADLLDAQGYAAAFVDLHAERAERALATAVGRTHLLDVATAYPHTPAAATAWYRLANRAWDRGHLGDFRDFARFCPERPGIAARLQRLDELTSRPAPADSVEGRLEDYDVMWQTPFRHATGRRTSHGHFVDVAEPAVAMAAVDEQTMAINSGRYAFLCNPLTGGRIGPVHRLGTDTLQPPYAAPAWDERHIVLLGRSGVFHTVTCLDQAGHQIWRANADSLGHQTACSNPVVADGHAIVCSVGTDDNGTTIRANGFDLYSGQLRWSTQIAKVPGRSRRQTVAAPQLAVIRNQVLLASQHGFLAVLSPSGRLLRLLGYPRSGED